MRLRAEVGYGLPAFRGKGAVTPFAGLSTTGFGRDWRAGALWRRGPALEMALEATRREAAGEPPAHGMAFRLTWRPGARMAFPPGAAGHDPHMDTPCAADETEAGDGGGEATIGPPAGGSAPAASSCASAPDTLRLDRALLGPECLRERTTPGHALRAWRHNIEGPRNAVVPG